MEISLRLEQICFAWYLPSREGEVKRGAVIRLALGPHASAMTMDDPLHRGQADAGAGEFVGGVQALEGTEKLAGVLRLEAAAVVPDKIGRTFGRPADAKLDLRRVPPACKLPGIVQEAFEGDFQEVGVAMHRASGSNDECHVAAGLRLLQRGDRKSVV